MTGVAVVNVIGIRFCGRFYWIGFMLKLTNVRKVFGKIVAVEDLSLEIDRGEVFGLLGPNGAGKSTTINMAIGRIRPDFGNVNVEGYGNPSAISVRQMLGVAPQELAIYEELTGEANLRLFGQLYGLSGRELKARVGEVLELVGLTDRKGDKAKVYSGGMLRRLNLAAALVHDPPLIMLDEPTVGVDPQSRNAIFEFVEGFKKQGRTIVYTTHYMEEAQRLCDRVGIIDHGKLLALDTVDRLISAHATTSTVVAERADGEERIETEDVRGELAKLLPRTDITGLRVERPNLESVFLALTGRSLRD